MRLSIFGGVLLSSAMSLHAAPVSVDASALGSDDSSFGIGFTSSAITRQYNNPDTVLAGLPFITARKNGFYINGVNVGYELTADPDPFVAPKPMLRIDLLAVPRFLGYKAEESPVLEGLDDAFYSIHAGASFTLVNVPVGLNVQFLTDILNESSGSEIIATLSKTVSVGKLGLTPALSFNWQNETLVDYYYGVEASEATATRAQFSPGSEISGALSLTAGFSISPKLSAFGAIRFEQLGGEIGDSPIVDEDTVSSATIGLVYTFSGIGKKDTGSNTF